MKLKKTWISFLEYPIFIMVVLAFLIGSGYELLNKYYFFIKMPGKADIIKILTAVTYFILCVILTLIIGQLTKKVRFLGPVLIFAIFCIGIFVRIVYLENNMDIIKNADYFYKIAFVEDKSPLDVNLSGIAYYYYVILRTLFSFVGNKVVFAALFQVLVQCVSGLFLYGAVKLSIGKNAAVFVFLAYCSMPIFMVIRPEELWGLFFCFTFFMLSLFLKNCSNQDISTGHIIVQGLFTSLFVAFYVLSDIFGLAFLFLMLFCILLIESEEKKIDIKKNILYFIVIFFSSLVFFAGLVFLKAYYFGSTIKDILLEYYLQYFSNNSFVFDKFVNNNFDIGIILLIFLYFALSLVWIIKYFKISQTKTLFLLLLIIFMTGITLLQKNEFDTEAFLLICCSLFAGLGMEGLTIKRERQVCVEAKNEVKEIMKNEVKDVVKKEVQLKEEIDLEQKTQENKPVIEFIDNPLPVPKKHVRKQMDYAIEPDARLMEFDIQELSKNDDFDIKS